LDLATKIPDGREPPTLLVLMTSFVHGGAERHTITLVNSFSRSMRVVLAYLKPDESLLPHLHRTQLHELAFLNARKGLDAQALGRLAALMDQHRPSLVLCVNAYPLMYAHLARRMAKAKPAIVDILHTTLMRTWKERLQMLLYRPFYWMSDRVVFVCENQQRHWRRRVLFSRRNAVIYNGVDTQFFAPFGPAQALSSRAAFGLHANDHVVGISAVLRPEKAHELLLQAVAQARTAGMGWKLLVIGDGVTRQRIEAEAQRLGLSDQMLITGLLPDVRQAIAACDVMALVSVSETFSIAAIEAMAMGKPMIMSNIGGAEEQVDTGRQGYLFPSRDVASLAECLRLCWDREHAASLGDNARRRVEAEFSMPAMLDAYTALLAHHIAELRPA
jgi:glycosyltransferase involved in cell wall biosynthesis